jgi:hypothetical protein
MPCRADPCTAGRATLADVAVAGDLARQPLDPRVIDVSATAISRPFAPRRNPWAIRSEASGVVEPAASLPRLGE